MSHSPFRVSPDAAPTQVAQEPIAPLPAQTIKKVAETGENLEKVAPPLPSHSPITPWGPAPGVNHKPFKI